MTLYDMVAYEGDDDYIFISYSHKDGAIVLPIIQLLQSQGFRIWFDKGIEPGTEWPEYIAEHLDACSVFISFMSPNASVSNNCRQEIHRAGSMRKDTLVAYIEQVQLSPGMDMRLGPLQAVKRWNFDSDEMFVESITTARLLQKCREGAKDPVVKSNPIAQHALPFRNTSHWQEIKEKNFPLATEKCEGKKFLLSKPFYGREWLLERMGTWLDEDAGGKLGAIYGGPGTGKSVVCVKWAFDEPRIVAAFSFVYERGARFTTATAMLQSLAFQLAASLPDYGARLDNMLKHTSIDSLSALELLDTAILDPLSHCRQNGNPKTYCIAIDGLDEVPVSERNAVTQAIRNLVQYSPDWLRVLVASRPDSDIALAIPPDYSIDIDADGLDNIKDVKKYLIEALSAFISDEEELIEAASALAARSGGVFLFAEAAVRAARRGGFNLSDESSYPNSLGSAFHSWFERAFPNDQEYQDRWRLPLGAIIAAPDSLPEIELERMLGICEADLLDLKQALGSILVVETDGYDEPVITFPHRYYSDWLESKDAGRYAILRRDSIRAMALACYEIAEADPASLTPYEAECLFTLLRFAGLTRQLAECSRNRKLAGRLMEVGDTYSYETPHGRRILTNRAETCLREALAIYETIASDTQDASDLKKYAGALEKLGEYWSSHDFRICKYPGYFEKAISIRKSLTEASHDRQEWLDYANALYTFGTYLPNDKEAVKHFDSALEILERIAESSGEFSDHRLLADSLEQIDRWIDNPDISLGYYARALEIRRSIAEETGDLSDCSSLADTLFAIGRLDCEKGENEHARERFEEAIRIQETLALETQDVQRYRSWASMLEQVGWSLIGWEFRWGAPSRHQFNWFHRRQSESSEHAEAAVYLQKSLDIWKDIAIRTKNLDDRRKMAITALGLNRITSEQLRVSKNLSQPSSCYEEALGFLEDISNDTEDIDDRRKLAAALTMAGRCAVDEGNPLIAQKLYEQASEDQERLVAETNDSDDKNHFARTLCALGNICYESNDAIGAEEYYAKAIDIQGELAIDEGMDYSYRVQLNRGYTNDYVWMLEDFGTRLFTANNFEKASGCFSKALEIKESCAHEGSAEDFEDIVRTLYMLTDIAKASDKETTANELHERILEITRIYKDLTQKTDVLYNRRELTKTLSICCLHARSHGDTEAELVFRAIALEVEREIVEETNEADDCRRYANDLYVMGITQDAQGETGMAKRYLEQSLIEREKLAAQTLERQDRRMLAETLTSLAFLGHGSTSTELPDRHQTTDYLSRAAAVRRELVTETSDLGDRRALSQVLHSLSLSMYIINRSEAKKLAKETLDFQNKIAEDTDAPEDLAALIDDLYFLALLEGDSDESKMHLARINEVLHDSSYAEEILQSSTIIQALTSQGKPSSNHV